MLNPLQHIQNSLARAVARAPKSSHINPAVKSLHWLKIKQYIDYKILSLTYTVNHKKGGSTFVIIMLENLDEF